MSTYYILGNFTKKEKIAFRSITNNSMSGITSSKECCDLIVRYMFKNAGDCISFVSDGGFEMFGINEDEAWNFKDVTEDYKKFSN
jgi:hypothetical protein